MVVCSLYMWLYINDHDFAILSGYLLCFSIVLPDATYLCMGIYYASVVGQSR
jgi:hypothetical protein